MGKIGRQKGAKIFTLESSTFNEILILIKTGLTISESLKKLKISKYHLYANISSEQRIVLGETKTSIASVGKNSPDMRYLRAFPHQLNEEN